MVMEEQKEYDNTNTGVGFKPFDDQKLILQGKFNVNGVEKSFAYHTAVSKDGSKRIDVYEKVGALFPNDKGDNELRPDYTGSMMNPDKLRLAAWKKTNDAGLKYMTLEASEPRDAKPELESEQSVLTDKETVDELTEDEVPF
jgi:uncharacterized protein (DUF736 family)